MYGVNGRKFQRQYKKSISDFKDWDQKEHAADWILYSENLSDQLSLDEVALSDGELYTVLTSKKAKGRKGSIVAIIKGTQSDKVIEQILKISRKLRQKVKEITLDMAGSMKLIAKRCFPNAVQVIDRFHVQKLATEALQNLRIQHRWEAIDLENTLLTEAKRERRSRKLKFLKMVIPESNSWQGADIYSTKPKKSGHQAKTKERTYYSRTIPT
ncbi:ISL3 family transposase [Kaistella flava (ex Peng et al. 2021)]|uniref:ISAon1 family transposase n=1 Tax=Kaistella flava (ex Peng et al. 2021) TaxID=2038776 RepID=UPI0039772E11